MPHAWPTHGLATALSCFDGARWRGKTVRSDVPTQSPTVFIFHHALPRASHLGCLAPTLCQALKLDISTLLAVSV